MVGKEYIPLRGSKVEGFIMIEHLRSVDWRSRRVVFKEKAGSTVIVNVMSAMQAVVS